MSAPRFLAECRKKGDRIGAIKKRRAMELWQMKSPQDQCAGAPRQNFRVGQIYGPRSTSVVRVVLNMTQ